MPALLLVALRVLDLVNEEKIPLLARACMFSHQYATMTQTQHDGQLSKSVSWVSQCRGGPQLSITSSDFR